MDGLLQLIRLPPLLSMLHALGGPGGVDGARVTWSIRNRSWTADGDRSSSTEGGLINGELLILTGVIMVISQVSLGSRATKLLK